MAGETLDEREMNVKWIEERMERKMSEEEKETEEGTRNEKVDRVRRERNMVWREVIGEDKEKRRGYIEEIMRKVLGREVRLRSVEERVGEAGRWVLLAEMVDLSDKREVLRRREEIGRRWRLRVDEDLTLEERRMRWRMMEAARCERARGIRTVVTNRKLWVDGVRWRWDEVGKAGMERGESEMKMGGRGRLRGEELSERNEGSFGETGF